MKSGTRGGQRYLGSNGRSFEIRNLVNSTHRSVPDVRAALYELRTAGLDIEPEGE